jgi:cellulose synthase/poly-beta-1,6-N-acetylglucosamine synthase-like glycosyltransferase
MAILIIFTLFAVCYTGIAIWLAAGMLKPYRYREGCPRVSVVVPARNEEHNLPPLLDSLLNLDYPKESLQILIANDQSDDRTFEVAESYKARFQCDYQVINSFDEENPNLRGRVRPIAQALDHATGDIYCITDADCVVPSAWVRAVTRYFADDVGLVGGITLPHREAIRGNPFGVMETLDWAFLLGASATLSSRGHSQAIIGNNLSLSREAYEAAGTYRNIPFSVTEDLALMQAVQDTGRFRAILPANAATLMRTQPLSSFAALISQRRRWLKGGAQIKGLGLFVLAYGFLAHLIWPLWFVLLGAYGFLCLAILLIGDGGVIYRVLKLAKQRGLIVFLPFYPIYAFIYPLVLAVSYLFTRRVKWKGRVYGPEKDK